MHQLYHSAEDRHHDRNFGSLLSLFDLLLGTLYLPKRGEDFRWGLNERELGSNNPHARLGSFYGEPFLNAWRVLTGRQVVR